MKYLIPALFIVFAFAPGPGWKKEVAKLSSAVKTGQMVEFTSTVKPANKKMKITDRELRLDRLMSVLMCDFLGEFTAVEYYAVSKFPYDKNGGMAYVIEQRLINTKTKSEIIRHILVTVNSSGEMVEERMLAHGGKFIFVNSEAGSCTDEEGANAILVTYGGNYTIHENMTITTNFGYKEDQLVYENGKIVKTMSEGALEMNTFELSINAEGSIVIKE